MPFLSTGAVRSWLVFIGVLLALALVDIALQDPLRDATVVSGIVAGWALLAVAGIAAIGVWRVARGARVPGRRAHR